MEKPFAITLDVGLLARQQDRLAGAPSGRSTSTGCRRATTHARPARTSRAGCIHAESGDYEAAWRDADARQSVARRSWAASAITRARARCNRGQLDDGGRHQLGRALPRRRGDEERLALRRRPTTESGKRRAGRRRRAVGLSAAYHLRRLGHAVTIDRGRARSPGGMMRFGIPKYRLPRDVLDAEIAAHRRHGRRRCSSDTKVDDIARDDEGRRLRRGLPRRRRAHRQARLHPGQGLGAQILDAVAVLRSMEGEATADARPARRRLRRRQHRDRRRAHREAARRDRGDHRLPAHAREDAGARLRGRGGARGRRAW